MSISNSHFYRNSADIGGVISSILGILNINNGSTLQGNKAESLRGGILSIASVIAGFYLLGEAGGKLPPLTAQLPPPKWFASDSTLI